MAVRQNKTISIGPDGILRIEAKNAIPDGIDKRRKRHGGAGMSGLSLLHCVNRERTNGIDAQLIQLCSGQSLNVGYCGTHDCLPGIKIKVPCGWSLSRNCGFVSNGAGSFVFQCSDFSQASQMTLGLTEFSSQVSLDKLPGQFRACDPAAQAD